jgi:membrane-associated PAP2 superfamily phosphatase
MEKLGRRPLPGGAEAWFAIPRWQALAPSYNEALEMVLNVVGKQRKLSNRVMDKLGPDFLRQSERSLCAREILLQQQSGNDVTVVAAQAGMLHRGCSARRARVVMRGNEFGLGAFSFACMLLTHPERLSSLDALMVDCCGDEYSLRGDRVFDRVPLFDYDLGGLQFSIFYEDRSRSMWGSPSCFLFQMT